MTIGALKVVPLGGRAVMFRAMPGVSGAFPATKAVPKLRPDGVRAVNFGTSCVP